MTAPVLFDSPTDLDSSSAAGAACRAEADDTPTAVVIEPNAPITRGMRKRWTVPVVGHVGLNGHGKSLTMVRDVLPHLLAGVPVLSTVALLDPFTGNPHPGYTRLQTWQQLLDFRGGALLLDEVTGVMDARDQGMPKHIRRHLHQMRRAGVRVRWTGIDWDNTDKRMRQITQAVVRCRGHWPVKPERGEVAMWAPNRMFVLTTFDAQTLSSSEDSGVLTEDTQKRRKAKVLHRELFVASNPLTGSTTLAFSAYDTMDSVSWVDNSCPICGGKPVEKTCRGHN